jgi:acetyl-CoA carboxylase biotin carboxyl carrier protein
MPEKKGLDLEILKEIIQIMKDDDLSEVCIEQNDVKIQVKRTPEQPIVAAQGVPALATHGETKERPSEIEDTEEGLVIIPAPMVGTFYMAPSPDAEPYVKIGDEIRDGQVICVIDAMKLMNEITADLEGEIVEILLEDGQPVEYDQPMFRVRPKNRQNR